MDGKTFHSVEQGLQMVTVLVICFCVKNYPKLTGLKRTNTYSLTVSLVRILLSRVCERVTSQVSVVLPG